MKIIVYMLLCCSALLYSSQSEKSEELKHLILQKLAQNLHDCTERCEKDVDSLEGNVFYMINQDCANSCLEQFSLSEDISTQAYETKWTIEKCLRDRENRPFFLHGEKPVYFETILQECINEHAPANNA